MVARPCQKHGRYHSLHCFAHLVHCPVLAMGRSKAKGIQYLEETRHGLIGTPNLQLVEVCLPIPTALVGTIHSSAIDIVPSVGATEDIIDVFSLEGFALVVAFLERVEVGAGGAYEGVLAGEMARVEVGVGDAVDCEEVGAGWAEEEHFWGVSVVCGVWGVCWLDR